MFFGIRITLFSSVEVQHLLQNIWPLVYHNLEVLFSCCCICAPNLVPRCLGTTIICRYCAHEFERWKSMAFAALSYKCMEVAYMQVVYSTDSIASRDRNELQMALEMVLPGNN